MDARSPVALHSSGRHERRARITLRQLAYIAGERMLGEAAEALGRNPFGRAEVTLLGSTVIGDVHAIRLDGPVAASATRRGDWDTWFRIDQVTSVRVLSGG